MKETDIVQALRCCAEGECKDCTMHEDKQRCQENLLDKAAEAIERLTAENAALREKVPLTEDAMINLAAHALGVEPSRLRELAEADKDGRLVMLPCKVGDTVYFALIRRIIEKQVFSIVSFSNSTRIYCGGTSEYFRPEDIGKTVFLTREEAEKALQGMEGKKDG